MTLVLVHQATEAQAAPILRRFGLEDVLRVSDPECRLYQVLGLHRRGLLAVMGPAAAWGGLRALLRGHGMGRVQGSVLQLPGAALVRDGVAVQVHRSRHSADRPSYLALARSWLA